jgi:hypothetical protein
VDCQADLAHVVRALRATGGGTCRLNRRQQERNQHANNGDDH